MRKLSQREKTAPSERAGAAVVELTFFLPVLFILVFGTIDLCQLIYLRQEALIVAFEGVRARAFGGFSNEESEALCRQMLSDRNVKGADVQFSLSNGDSSGSEVSLELTVDVGENRLPFFFFKNQEINIRRQAILE